MSATAPAPRSEEPIDAEQLERFYRQLLVIDEVSDPEPLLDEALRLLVQLTCAQLAYVELTDQTSSTSELPYWRGYADARAGASVRVLISHSIVRATIAEHRLIETNSAVGDARFLEIASVRQNQIAAVLSVPIGKEPCVGALLLQSAQAVSPKARTFVALLSHRIARIAPRLLRGKTSPRQSLRQQIRALQRRRVKEAMERHDDNIAEVARELGVGRAFVYRILRRRGQTSAE